MSLHFFLQPLVSCSHPSLLAICQEFKPNRLISKSCAPCIFPPSSCLALINQFRKTCARKFIARIIFRRCPILSWHLSTRVATITTTPITIKRKEVRREERAPRENIFLFLLFVFSRTASVAPLYMIMSFF